MATVAADLEYDIVSCLKEAFPGAEVTDFGRPARGRRIGGLLVWDGFDGLSQLERQNRVWAALRERLDVPALQEISLIMTFTPRELAALDAD
jgi:acid stress-induced BolA-like protein IbaG/YrbA